MTVRAATVLSARDWEPNLVAMGRDSAALRIVLRAFQPEDIEANLDAIDVVVVGGEVSWATPAVIAAWRTAGLGVIGVAPSGDLPSRNLLEAGGCDEVVPDTIDTVALIQAIRFAAPRRDVPVRSIRGHLTAVVGSRGAPGCTEVALSFALRCSDLGKSTVLVDLDVDAPAIAIRLGLPPRPDLVDAADSAVSGGTIGTTATHRFGSLAVISGIHRPERGTVRTSDVDAIVRAAVAEWDVVVLDFATGDPTSLERTPDSTILVVEGSALGIVRAAEKVAEWFGPTPALVLNRVPSGRASEVVEAARRWTGLDPAVAIPERPQVRRVAAKSGWPDRRFVRSVGRLRVPA